MPEFSELDRLSDDEIRKLWSGVQALNQSESGRKLVRRAVQEIRSGKFANQNRPRNINLPTNFDPLEQIYGSDNESEESQH